MAKRVVKKPQWLQAPQVTDIYSVAGCISEDFADYIKFWKHNGYWFFDSPEIILGVAEENSLPLDGTSLFYYEAYEKEYKGESWLPYGVENDFPINVHVPPRKQLEGFDVVTFSVGTSPECSPLSCNSLAEKLRTNEHCLFTSFAEAEMNVSKGAFNDSEPGPYRIISVSSVEWPPGPRKGRP